MTENNYHKMKLRQITSSGNSREFHEILKKRNNLLKKDYGCNGIIISAPHHSPKGLENIAGGTRPADNNTGYVARNIADHCKGQLVIATRATEDPNKTEGTFHKHTVGKSPNVYVEIHGHVSANYDIEISCGAQSHTKHSEKLAEKVTQYLNDIATNVEMSKPEMAEQLRNLTVCGNYEDIKMKANRTKTITDARNAGSNAYHIELSSELRMKDVGTNESIPEIGVYVSRAISAALADVHGECIKSKSPKLEEPL